MNEYTYDELKQLFEMSGTTRIGRFVCACLGGMRCSQELEQRLKRKIISGMIEDSHIDEYFQQLYDLMFTVPLTEVPLHINEIFREADGNEGHPSCRVVAKWRLTIGK